MKNYEHITTIEKNLETIETHFKTRGSSDLAIEEKVNLDGGDNVLKIFYNSQTGEICRTGTQNLIARYDPAKGLDSLKFDTFEPMFVGEEEPVYRGTVIAELSVQAYILNLQEGRE